MLDDTYCVQQFADSFESEIFALYGYDHRVSSCKGVHCDKSERRTAVDEDIVVFVSYGSKDVTYNLLPVVHVQHLYLGTYQVNVTWDDVKSVDIGSVDSVTDVCLIDDALVK